MAAIAFIRCPECNTVIEKPAAGTPVCPNCGFGAPKGAKKSAKAAAAVPPMAAAPSAWTPAPATPAYSSPPMLSPEGMPMMQKTSGKAIAAMVVGIVACCVPFVIPIVGPFIALAAGIVALVLGILANRECNREPERIKGKGMAITGMVLGSIMVVLGVLGLLVVFVFLDAIEKAVCEDDPDSEECQQFRDAFAESDPGPTAAVGLRGLAASWLAAGGRLALPA